MQSFFNINCNNLGSFLYIPGIRKKNDNIFSHRWTLHDADDIGLLIFEQFLTVDVFTRDMIEMYEVIIMTSCKNCFSQSILPHSQIMTEFQVKVIQHWWERNIHRISVSWWEAVKTWFPHLQRVTIETRHVNLVPSPLESYNRDTSCKTWLLHL